MLFIGVFAFLMTLFGNVWPAHAVPVAIVALAIGASELSVAAIALTAVINLALTTALSFVAQALLRPSQTSGKAATPQSTVDNSITTQQPTAPRQLVYGNCRVGGIYALVHTTNNNHDLHLVICYAGHQSEAIDEVWFDDNRLVLDGDGNVIGQIDPTTGFTVGSAYAGKARIKIHLGAPDQEADPDLIAAAPDVWTANHRLRGITYLYVHLGWDRTTYTNGVPNITALGRWKNDIYDPRTGTTGYSSNSALVLANYMCDPVYGLPVDYATGIDEEALIASANGCDEDIALADGTTEKRYSTDGGQTVDATPQDIIGRLLGAMIGSMPYNGSRWRILAGIWQEPSFDFNDDMLRAGPQIQVLTSRRDLFNTVAGTYVGPANNWQSASFPQVTSNAFVAEDQQQIVKNIDLPLTSSPSRAQRIAKIYILSARQQIVGTMPMNLSGWRAQAGDVGTWTSPRYGWDHKNYLASNIKFTVDTDNGPPKLGVDVTLQETDPTIYDWATDEEITVDPAPNTNFPDPFNVLPPSNLVVGESLYATRDGGGVKAKATLSWDASVDGFVNSGGHYLPQYRLSGAAAFIDGTPTTALTADILDVAPGTYDFQVVAVNYAGNRSTPLTVTQEIVGLSAPPSAPTGLQVTAAGLGTLAMLRWDRSPDLDVLQGGNIVFRFSSMTSGATWADATTVSAPLDGSQTQAVLPLKKGTYLAKFVDSTGNWSDATSVVSEQGSSIAFTTLGDLVESPGFSGTGTNTMIVGGDLMLGGGGLFDDVPDVDALASWDFAGGVATSGSYAFSGPLDLGSVQPCRLTTLLASQVVNELDTIDSRSGNVDDWADWDGAVSGQEADALLYVQSTNDDPASGTAVWSAWNRLDSAEFTARAFRFRLDLSSSDQSFNIHVSQLAVVAEAPV